MFGMDNSSNANTKCVECMCLMTLLQEHISLKHSAQDTPHFELSEWQQAGYKQTIKWALKCDRCDFTTTNKARMFEHIANHQLLENTVQRINQSSAGAPAFSTPKLVKPIPVKEKPKHSSTPQPQLTPQFPLRPQVSSTPQLPYCPDVKKVDEQSDMSDASVYEASHMTPGSIMTQHDDDSPRATVKDEFPEPILIHMEETDIDEINRNQNQQPPPLTIAPNQIEPRAKRPPLTSPFQASQPAVSEGSHQCKWCEYKGASFANLMHHTRLEHKMFYCSICDFIGNKASDLEIHMTDFHKSMLCIYCGITSGNMRALRKHYSVDHGTKLKKCHQCSFVTSNKTILTHHVNREHHRRKPRACPYCDYVAYADNRLKQHVLAIHEKQTPFPCPQCATRFARKSQLKQHMRRRHQLEMPAEFSQFPELGYGMSMVTSDELGATQDNAPERAAELLDSSSLPQKTMLESGVAD
ncbi:zinc finger Y-chromosomal protein 2-like isoform X1 [Watersipora subatra]|uniref:zinc finger Y-chromosomal protein 2-like isoform X1 n=1 Tax=Watersipora subatra TaxID=2589382 RepID=UPI00355BBABA